MDEAAADMFLNWIYKTLSMEGFENVSWKTNESDESGFCNRSSGTGCEDSTRKPGDARFDWMEVEIQTIFNNHGWGN